MRTFVAIEFDDAIRERLAAAQEVLRGAGCKVKWVERAKMHLTLKFLGEIDPEQVEPVASVMGEAAAEAAPFEARVAGLGAFPPRGAPRVVWAAIEDPSGALAALQRRLDRGLEALGFERERRAFRPHLTLGRVKDRRGAERLRALLDDQATAAFGTQTVQELILFRSQLSPQGPTYTPLHRQLL